MEYIVFYVYFSGYSVLWPTHLTLPVITPPLCNINSLALKRTGLEIARPLVDDRYKVSAVERDEGELRQINLMYLLEDALAYP